MKSPLRSRRWHALAGVVLVAAASAGPCALAADPAPGAAPRIGLALSGGGARGIAHVGVLKVLEELRVPVHCVTGTSMGAIVGATFAAGRTPQEMERLVLDADWDEIFRDRPPRDEIAVRRKVDDYKTLFAPEYGVKDGGLALPKGVIAGVSIESFFRQLSAPAFEITDFRRLPIPFRAMATDIETGEPVVLESGSIAQAMRASMSVPGAIAPVERDGRLLVDGGIANNLPIDEVRNLCADVVIAVNISTPPLRRDQLTSALSVAGQLINFLGKQTVDAQLRSLGERDVLIAPDLGNVSASTFDRSADAIRIGEEATRALADSLRRYSLPPEQYAALRARQVVTAKDLGRVDEIRVEGLERTNPRVVRALVDSRPGEPLTEEAIGRDLRRVFGTRDYESIGYRIVGGETGPRALVIDPKEKDWGPDYLRFGLGLASNFSGDNQFNLLAQYRRTWLNRLGAEWLTEVQIGQDTRLATQFYQPFDDRGRWFVQPSAALARTTRGVFVGDDRVATYLVDTAQGGLGFGRVLDTWGQVQATAVWARVDAEVDTGEPLLPAARETTAGMRLDLFVDQTDSAWFPRAGYALLGSAYAGLPSFGSAAEYQRYELSSRVIRSWGAHTVNLGLAGGTLRGAEAPAYEGFSLGGPLRMSAFRVDELAGSEYLFGRLMYYNRTLPLPDILGSGVYVGGSAELARVSERIGDLPVPGTVWSLSAFLGADTFLGPMYLGVGFGEGSRSSLYLLLGAP